MAKPFVDGSTAASAAVMNKLIHGDGTSEALVLLAFRVYYDGATWQVASQGSAVDANIRAELKAELTWHASNYLEIDFSGGGTYFRGFSSIPVISCDSTANATRKMPADGVAVSATEARVYFYNQTDRTTQETTESTAMDCTLIFIGISDV